MLVAVEIEDWAVAVELQLSGLRVKEPTQVRPTVAGIQHIQGKAPPGDGGVVFGPELGVDALVINLEAGAAALEDRAAGAEGGLAQEVGPGQGGTALESGAADAPDACGDRDGGHAAAAEGVVADGRDGFGNRQIPKSGAALEGVVADDCGAVGDGDGAQGGAALEGGLAHGGGPAVQQPLARLLHRVKSGQTDCLGDGGKAVDAFAAGFGDDGGAQIPAPGKGVAAEAREAGGQAQIRQSRAAAEGVGAYGAHTLGDYHGLDGAGVAGPGGGALETIVIHGAGAADGQGGGISIPAPAHGRAALGRSGLRGADHGDGSVLPAGLAVGGPGIGVGRVVIDGHLSGGVVEQAGAARAGLCAAEGHARQRAAIVKGVGADALEPQTEADLGQRGAAGEGVGADTLDAVGQDHLIQQIAVIKAVLADGAHTLGDLDGGQLVAVLEGAVAQGPEAVGQDDGFQLLAAAEGFAADADHGPQEDHFRQLGAALKGGAFDHRDPCGNGDGGEFGTLEGKAADLGDIVRDLKVQQARALAEAAAANLRHGVREADAFQPAAVVEQTVG